MKHIEKLQEFIHEQLDSYSYFEGWEIKIESESEEGKPEYYDLELKAGGKYAKTIPIKCEFSKEHPDDTEISVKIHEDGSYEKVNDHSWNEKHFWMAILNWEY